MSDDQVNPFVKILIGHMDRLPLAIKYQLAFELFMNCMERPHFRSLLEALSVRDDFEQSLLKLAAVFDAIDKTANEAVPVEVEVLEATSPEELVQLITERVYEAAGKEVPPPKTDIKPSSN